MNIIPPSDGVTRLNNIQIVGVIVTDTLSFEMHISGGYIQMRTNKLRIKNHACTRTQWSSLMGCNKVNPSVQTHVCFSCMVWLPKRGEWKRCQAVPNRMEACRLSRGGLQELHWVMWKADVGLFKAVTSNPDHVMYQLLPPLKSTPYHLRPRAHNF